MQAPELTVVSRMQKDSSWSCGASGMNEEHTATAQFMEYINGMACKTISGVDGVQGESSVTPVWGMCLVLEVGPQR